MGHVRKGHLAAAPEWWKHLRHTKRLFWSRHRQAERRHARRALAEVRDA